MGIRVASADDAAAVAAIYAPYVLDTAISFEETPPSPDEMAGRIAATLATYPFLVAEQDGAIVGYAYGGAHSARPAYRWSANVSVYVDGGAHRRGVGRSLYTALIDHLRRQGMHSLFAGIALPNDKSVGLHEALGFVHLGTYQDVGFKLGRWHDAGYWRLGLRTGAPTSDPTPFAALS